MPTEPQERCGTCDRDAYHENDWHCSQGKEKEISKCEDCDIINAEDFSYYENRCGDCCYKKDMRNREYDREQEIIAKIKEEEGLDEEPQRVFESDRDYKARIKLNYRLTPASGDARGNTPEDYKKAEDECPKGYCVVWNSYEKGFKYRKIDEDGYIMDEDLYGQEAAKKEKKQEIIAKIKKEIPFVDIKPFSHNIITLELGLLEEVAGREAVVELVQTTELKNKGWGFITSIEG